MKRLVSTALMVALTLFVLILSAIPASCWQRPMMPMDPTMGGVGPMGPMGPGGPACPPQGCAPQGCAPACPPPGCGPGMPPMMMGPCQPKCDPPLKIGFEGGGRVYYTTNVLLVTYGDRPNIDYVKDLKFSPTTLVGEVYGAIRVAPYFGFSYSFVWPRLDSGSGPLPTTITIGKTTFPAGTAVTIQSSTSLHRWEAEGYLGIGCNYRIGAYVLGELWVRNVDITTAATTDQQLNQEFLMGVGGVGEFAPINSLFLKVKGAYTFLQNQDGFYIDGEAKFFPELNLGGGCGGPSSFRPYASLGFRYRNAVVTPNENQKIQFAVYGPYAEVGAVF